MNVSIVHRKDALQNIPDPCSKQGVSHPFHGILPLVILGLTARQIYMGRGVDGIGENGCVADESVASRGANDMGGEGEMLSRSNANRKETRMEKNRRVDGLRALTEYSGETS